MMLSRAQLAFITGLFYFSIPVHGESSEECLNRITQDRVESARKLCQAQISAASGLNSDGSAEIQQVADCEKDAAKEPPSDAEMQTCFKEDHPDDVGNAFDVPPVKPATPLPRPAAFAPAPKPAATPSKPATASRPATKPVASRPASKPPNKNPSGSGTTPESPDTAQGYASADVDACLSARSDASQCCNNPLSCSSSLSYSDQQSLQSLNQQMSDGPKQGQSISDYCSQMRQASSNSGNVNNGLSSICYSNQSSCTSTCSSLVQKYQALLDNCDGCDSENIYQSTLLTLQNANSTCQNLRANVSALAQQGVGSSSGQAYGSLCQQQAGFGPSSLDGSGPNAIANQPLTDIYNCSQNPQSPNCQASCTTNPNSDACKALQQGQALQKGKVGFQNAGKKDGAGAFNPQDANMNADSFAGLNAQMKNGTADAQQIANQNRGVPNNTGGAIPGQQNTAGQATLASGKPAQPTQPGPDTDIMKGNLAGGYSQGSGFESMMASGSAFRTLASASMAAGKVSDGGIDLKRYLPGAGLDQNRLGLYGRSPEINGKAADLFKKISNKLVEKCKLGVLWDCKS